MEDLGSTVHAWRTEAGLSLRALARNAEVSFTTVFRIERGEIDPSFTTLRKIARATGHDLVVTQRREGDGPGELAGLAKRWERNALGDRPDWTAWRSLLASWEGDAEAISRAIARAPAPSGSALIDNLLAAVAEKSADDARLRRPRWTRQLPRLDVPYRAEVPIWRAATGAPVPTQFKARGLYIAEDSLWRDPVGSDV